MLRFVVLLLLTALSALWMAPASAEDVTAGNLPERLRLGTFHIPLLAESASRGRFVELARRVAAEAGLELDIVFMPTQRTREAFAERALDGFFPALASTLTVPYNASTAFSTKRIYAYTLSGQPLISRAEDLEGHQVGYTEGFTYPDEMMRVSGAQYQSANTDPQNLRKLLAGRIDVFLGDEDSTRENIRQQLAVGRIVYDELHPLAILPIFFAFQPDAHGRELAGRFSSAIRRLNQSGELMRILAPDGQ
ncbi:substrate-binding periplasmic protein [Thalassolituus sp. LLYu03]|uniref:substrate-binding periplasmic protein n=1 Tax=Thalassolituus sp. LLYu03 TaxID=3421656 RepID=UPI003D299045